MVGGPGIEPIVLIIVGVANAVIYPMINVPEIFSLGTMAG
jgi:hypothetical protein